MADFSTPDFSSLINQGDYQIAAGPPKVDLSSLFKDYVAGKNADYQQRQQDLFKNGIPKDANGNIDLGKAVQQTVQSQGASALPQLMTYGKLMYGQQAGNAAFPTGDQSSAPTQAAPGTLPPSASPALPNNTPTQQTDNLQPGSYPSRPMPPGQRAGGDNGDGRSIVDMVSTTGLPPEKQGPLIAALSQRAGVDPNQPIADMGLRSRIGTLIQSQAYGGTPGAPGAQQVAQAAPAQGATPAPVSAPAAAPQTGDAPFPAPTAPAQGAPGGGDPSLGGLVPPNFVQKFGADAPGQYVSMLGKYLSSGMLAPDQAKAIQSKMTAIQTTMEKQNEPTPAGKDYATAVRQGYRGTQQQYAADSAGMVKETEGQVASLGKLADAGIEAKGRLGQLDTIDHLGQKVGYGVVPKIQDVLGQYGIDTKGLSDIQAYQRAIDFMAPQLRPVGSGRLMQQELTAFKASLGGLMTTPEGRKISINNLKLINNYSAQIGQVATDTSIPPSQRMKTIENMPPPKLQTTAPKAAAPTSSAPTVNSKADFDSLPSGATFTSGGKTWRKP